MVSSDSLSPEARPSTYINMTTQRIKLYPILPLKFNDIGEVRDYLARLTQAINEESVDRLQDFGEAALAPALPWVDIRTFGAVITSSDNTSSIQNAINSLGSGGTVIIPPGTWITGKLTLSNNTRILGMGWGSILKLKNSTNDDLLYATGKSNISVENLSLDGNQDNQSAQKAGVRFVSCFNCDAEDCYIHDAKYAGIQYVSSTGMWASENLLENNASIGVMMSGTVKSMVTENYITNDAGGVSGYHGILLYNGSNYNTVSENVVAPTGKIIGIEVYNSHYNSVSDNILYRCGNGIEVSSASAYNMIQGNYCENAKAQTTDESGIEINAATYNIVSDNICRNNKMSGIYVLGSANHNTVSGNACSYNGGAGVNIQSSNYCIVSDNRCTFNDGRGIRIFESSFANYDGNRCMNNGQAGAYSGIELDDSTYNIVSDNICTDDQTPKTQTYGIEEKVTSDWNLINDNIVIGNSTGGLSITGANTIDSGNLEP